MSEGRFGRMEAAPVGKLWVRDPASGEAVLVDADPVTVDSSVEFSGLSDVADPSDPVVFESEAVEDAPPVEVEPEVVEAEVEVVEAEVDAEADAEVVEAEVDVVEVEAAAPVEAEVVESLGLDAPKPGPRRGRPRKNP